MTSFWAYIVSQDDHNRAAFSHQLFISSIPVSSENIDVIVYMIYKQTYYYIKAYSWLGTSEKLAILDTPKSTFFRADYQILINSIN